MNTTDRLKFTAIPLILFALNADVLAGNRQSPLEPKPVKTFKHLKQLLNKKSVRSNRQMLFKMQEMAGDVALFSDPSVFEHSETNVQVAGVDEGDSVKTDGQYIYRIQNGQVQIVATRPATAMAVEASLTFDSGFYPIELYVHNDLLVVIGSGWHDDGTTEDVPVLRAKGRAKLAIWTPSGESRTMAKVYDISDRANPTLKREIAFSGNYLSSRRIGDNVYLIGRNFPYYYLYDFARPTGHKRDQEMTRDDVLPHIIDSITDNGAEHTLPIKDLYYFPQFTTADYVVVASFRLNDLAEAANIKAYLGSGDIVYASKDNLYLSAADYNANPNNNQTVSAPVTHLYKFAISDGEINFSNAGEIPGTALNSYSMDEHNGYFRIATTTDQWTQTDDGGDAQTWNNLYTLNEEMKIVGSLEHLAEGERIYSARFMGDRGYLVTFEQTDPLFVIDLATPEAPKVLGELKIPGFSNYLHPYDDTHLLGFGQDTRVTDNGVLTTGVKIALFDVTNVSKPHEMYSLTIGEQGSYSPVQWDPKALLFDKQRNLLGFPISVSQQKAGAEWPEEVFQGAYVYKVSLGQGFEKQAKITHMPEGSQYDWNHYIDRLLTIGNQLYTLSPARIQANDLTLFDLTGSLDTPILPLPGDCTSPVSDEAELSLIPSDCLMLVDPMTKPTAIN